jgi:hypothetical protein
MYKFKTYLAVSVKYLENSQALLWVYSGCHIGDFEDKCIQDVALFSLADMYCPWLTTIALPLTVKPRSLIPWLKKYQPLSLHVSHSTGCHLSAAHVTASLQSTICLTIATQNTTANSSSHLHTHANWNTSVTGHKQNYTTAKVRVVHVTQQQYQHLIATSHQYVATSLMERQQAFLKRYFSTISHPKMILFPLFC